MPAVGAGLDVTTHDGGATGLYRRHHLELVQAQVPGMGHPVSGARRAEDGGKFECSAQRPQPPDALSLEEAIVSLSSGLVTLRIVRVATLV